MQWSGLSRRGSGKNYIEGKRYIFRPSAQEPKASEPISKPRIVTNLAPKIHKNVSEPKPALSPVRRSVPSRKEEDQQLSFVFEPSDSGGWDIKTWASLGLSYHKAAM